MTTQILDIARACYDAYARSDRAAIEAILAPDFRFTSPLDNAIDRDAYFSICWPNSANIEDFSIIYLVDAAGQVFVTYEGKRANGRVFRNTEVLTFSGEQISMIEVYFGWGIPHEVPPGEHREP